MSSNYSATTDCCSAQPFHDQDRRQPISYPPVTASCVQLSGQLSSHIPDKMPWMSDSLNCSECAECPGEFTSQCTDQCIVVACDDPAHSGFDCNSACDLESSNCFDCHLPSSELRMFNHYQPDACCPEFGSKTCADWKQFLCSCVDHHDHPLSNSQSSASSPLTSHLSVSHSPQSTPSLPSLDHQCQWGSCNSSFMSFAELAEHVNSFHLGTSFPSATSSPPAPTSEIVTATTAPKVDPPRLDTCLWADCDMDIASLPKLPLTTPTDIANLAAHLFEHHLGIPFPPTHESAMLPPASSLSPGPFDPSANHAAATTAHENDLQSLQTPTSPTLSSSSAPSLLSHPLSLPSTSYTPSQLSSVLSTLSSFSPTQTSPSPLSAGLSSPTGRATPPAPSSDVEGAAAGGHVCRWDVSDDVNGGSECGARFQTLAALSSHLSVAHVGGRKSHYECRWVGCARRGAQHGFASKQKICRHLQSHTGHRPFQCTVCQQYFSEAATLQQHMRRHTHERPYMCDYPGCTKSFAIMGALTIHKRTHNGEKPFKCSVCGKGFAESSNLSKHIRTHTGARPHTCSVCGKSFGRPDQLSRHTAIHARKQA